MGELILFALDPRPSTLNSLTQCLQRSGWVLRGRVGATILFLMKTICLQLPDSEALELTEVTELCGYASEEELTRVALRRFLDSHTAKLQEQFVMQDVAWGLHGKD